MAGISVYIQALIYIVAGLNHFVNPKTYLAIMPPYIPAHQTMVLLSGIAEVLLGVGLLFPATRTLASWGLIILLIAVFPANLYMAMSSHFSQFPAWLRWARLPVQGLLIWWAYKTK